LQALASMIIRHSRSESSSIALLNPLALTPAAWAAPSTEYDSPFGRRPKTQSLAAAWVRTVRHLVRTGNGWSGMLGSL